MIFDVEIIVNRICYFLDMESMVRVMFMNRCFYNEAVYWMGRTKLPPTSNMKICDFMKYLHDKSNLNREDTYLHCLKTHEITREVPEYNHKNLPVLGITFDRQNLFYYYSGVGWCRRILPRRNSFPNIFYTKHFWLTLFAGQGFPDHLYNEITGMKYFFGGDILHIIFCGEDDDNLFLEVSMNSPHYTRSTISINCVTMTKNLSSKCPPITVLQICQS